MNRSQKLFGMSLLALVVSGCAVTSEPIDRSVSEQRARTDLQSMYKDQEPLSGPLTLHQAMARAVKYNLEGRLKIMEEALAKRQLDLASFDMLPRMALDAGYVGRNNVNASSSQSVETGTQSLEPSTSQDRDREVADLTMVWNVLDFGVSYISAKQAGDQRLIVQERRAQGDQHDRPGRAFGLLASHGRRASAQADRQPDGAGRDGTWQQPEHERAAHR